MNQQVATPGPIVMDQILPPKEYLGVELRNGQTLRIVDVEGKQVPDLVAFNLHDPRERMSTNNSRLVQKKWLLTTGDALYSDEGNVLLRITDDGASWAPTWSPAGDGIAFLHLDGQTVDLRLAKLDGSAPAWTVGETTNLTEVSGLEPASRPDWYIPADQLPATPPPASGEPSASPAP